MRGAVIDAGGELDKIKAADEFYDLVNALLQAT